MDEEMNFNGENGKGNIADNTLEDRLGQPDLFEQLDTQFVKDETSSQTIIKRMFLPKSLLDKTDIDFEECPNISRLIFISRKFNLPSGMDFVNTFLASRISKDRKGRTEGFEVVASENVGKNSANKPVISFLGGKLPTL